MANAQPGILGAIPRLARYLTFSQRPELDPRAESDPRAALAALADAVDGEELVVGIGRSLALYLGCDIDGLRVFPGHAGVGFEVPSTPAALWCWIRGNDRGEILHRSRRVQRTVAPAFAVDEVTDAFQYRTALDLTGYEDGTENPQGDAAVEAFRGLSLDRGLAVVVDREAGTSRDDRAALYLRLLEKSRLHDGVGVLIVIPGTDAPHFPPLAARPSLPGAEIAAAVGTDGVRAEESAVGRLIARSWSGRDTTTGKPLLFAGDDVLRELGRPRRHPTSSSPSCGRATARARPRPTPWWCTTTAPSPTAASSTAAWSAASRRPSRSTG